MSTTRRTRFASQKDDDFITNQDDEDYDEQSEYNEDDTELFMPQRVTSPATTSTSKRSSKDKDQLKRRREQVRYVLRDTADIVSLERIVHFSLSLWK